jgi:hypothetical protein
MIPTCLSASFTCPTCQLFAFHVLIDNLMPSFIFIYLQFSFWCHQVILLFAYSVSFNFEEQMSSSYDSFMIHKCIEIRAHNP